jgi:hypothetical protein
VSCCDGLLGVPAAKNVVVGSGEAGPGVLPSRSDALVKPYQLVVAEPGGLGVGVL